MLEGRADATDQYYRSVAKGIPWSIGYSARGVNCCKRETRLPGNGVEVQFGGKLCGARIASDAIL